MRKDGNPRWLTEEKIRRLNDIGFEWRLKPEIICKKRKPSSTAFSSEQLI
jgi:hypothetical protein